VTRPRSWDEAVAYLDGAGEYEAANVLRRVDEPGRDERLARFFEPTDPRLAERWRIEHSAAGCYLRGLADVRERRRDLLRALEEVRGALEREGRWESTYEWRMATAGTDALEKSGAAYRASATHHGTFAASFATLPEAWEALSVLSRLQQDLFYAAGWSSWAARAQLEPGDDVHEAAESDEPRLAYLTEISREARDEARRLAAAIADSLGRAEPWQEDVEGGTALAAVISEERWMDEEGGAPFVEASARHGSLLFTTYAPTADRAAQFLRIYTRLIGDLAAVLEWRWLP
jgi:hypothetical protein